MPSIRPSVLVVVLVMVLAGCGGTGGTGTAPGDGTPTPTGTHVDSPETASPPAGATFTAIENVSALIDAHVAELQGVDHRVEVSLLANRSEALREPLNATVHYGENATYVDQRANASRYGVLPHESYREGSTLFEKREDGQDRYYYRHDTRPDAIFWTAAPRPLTALRGFLARGNFEYVETIEGPEHLRFEANSSGEGDVRQFEGSVRVSLDGVVHAAEGSYVVDRDGEQPYRVEFSYDLQLDVGPPEQPAWIEEVPQPVVERTANGTVLALENRGGTAIEAGTEFGVILSDPDDPIAGNVTLPERLGPGETVYVYAVRTGDGREIRIAAEPPDESGDLVDLRDRVVRVGHDSDRLRLQVALPAENETD